MSGFTRRFALRREWQGFMFWTPWIVGRITWNRNGRFSNGHRFWVITSRRHWEWEQENL